MIKIGQINEFKYAGKVNTGVILSAFDEEVLLPFDSVTGSLDPDEPVHAFVFINSDGRLIASLKKPFAVAGEFALLEVVDQNDKGAFLNIGIEKDAFLPLREQKRPVRIGESVVAKIYINEFNNRIEASTKVSSFNNEEEINFEVGDEVELLIADPSDLGYNAIINKRFVGLLYHNELFEHINPGEVRKGYIKKVREENKIDLSLNPIGYSHILDTKEGLLGKLEENNGVLDLGDKSSPTEIYKRLKISKKAFKKAVGGLYKDRLIQVSDYEIRLIKDE
jgi:uncharacterized protein